MSDIGQKCIVLLLCGDESHQLTAANVRLTVDLQQLHMDKPSRYFKVTVFVVHNFLFFFFVWCLPAAQKGNIFQENNNTKRVFTNLEDAH